MEEVKKILDAAEEKMQHAVHFLEESLVHIRAGKASVRVLDNIRVDYYGSPTPLSGVATVTVPDAKSIAIQPWEKQLIREIERAILGSDLGITPENNGETIRLNFPPLTEERRKALVKQSKSEAEEAKTSVRNARRDAIEHLKKAVKNGLSEDLGKDAEADAQKLHDKYIKKIDETLAAKEKEILTV